MSCGSRRLLGGALGAVLAAWYQVASRSTTGQAFPTSPTATSYRRRWICPGRLVNAQLLFPLSSSS